MLAPPQPDESQAMHDADPVLVDLPVPVRTLRLLLRPAAAGDGAGLLEGKRESWPELGRWLDWAHGPVGRLHGDAEEAYARRKAADFALREDVRLGVFDRDGGRLLGVADLPGVDWTRRLFRVGYWVRTGETGRGFATEALNALVRYAFGAPSANRVAASHADGNDASRRVIERCGFRQEGFARRSLLVGGALLDVRHYARLDAAGLPDLDVSWG